jgi:hypothetical protein
MTTEHEALLVWADKAKNAVYLACDKEPADDVSAGIANLAAAIRTLEARLALFTRLAPNKAESLVKMYHELETERTAREEAEQATKRIGGGYWPAYTNLMQKYINRAEQRATAAEAQAQSYHQGLVNTGVELHKALARLAQVERETIEKMKERLCESCRKKF